MDSPDIVMRGGVIVHLFRSPILHESRLMKEARSALRSGVAQRILVIGIWQAGVAERDCIEPGIVVVRIRLRSRDLSKGLLPQTLKYMEWILKALRQVRDARPLVLHAHSLDALPIAIIARTFYRCAIVYDAHELESERTGLNGLRQRLARWVERLSIGAADQVLVVSDGIADWYQKNYGISRPTVVRNVPTSCRHDDRESPLRRRCGIPPDELLFLYVGLLGTGRSIPRLCSVFGQVPVNRHMVFMGYGTMEGLIRECAGRHANIHFLPAVPPDEVNLNIRGADVGVCLIEDVSLSYKLSLPNKLLQCITEGVPVLVNDLPEQSELVTQLGCGWIAPASDEDLVAFIASLGESDIRTKAQRAREAANLFSWDRELDPYLRFCRQLGAESL